MVTKVRLKWVKNRGLDHIIDRDTDLKAACLLKDFLLRYHQRHPTSPVTARTLSPLQKTLGLTIPVLRFLRRYPTLFRECPHPSYPTLPSFSPSPVALLLHRRELAAHTSSSAADAARLARLLMMTTSRSLPIRSLLPLRWDLGLPDDFLTTLIPAFPDHFRLERRNGLPHLSLANWRDDLAQSSLQRMNDRASSNAEYRNFKRASTMQISNSYLTFPMSFPRGYGSQNKVKAWMEEFHRLPYVSPYEDASGLDPESDIAEKRVVGLLHELLGLTVHKKTKRNYLRCLREELGLPHKFTRVFTRYPGIFYLSLKCKTTTVVLREGYQRGKLVDPHPITLIRDRFYHVMRTGVLYRDNGMQEAMLAASGEGRDSINEDGEEDGRGSDEELETYDDDEGEEEFCDTDASDVEMGSEED